MVLKKILQKIGNLFVRFKKTKEYVMTEEDVERLSEAIEKDRAMKEAKIALLERKIRKEEEKEKAEEDKNLINKSLQKKRKAIIRKQRMSPFDWGRFFKIYNKSKKKWKFRVLSYDLKRDFGYFDTLVTLKNGLIGLSVIDREKKRNIIISGRTIKDILYNFKGLGDMAEKGVFMVNLNENGEFVNNILEEEIPELIVDKEGKYIHSKVRTQPLMDIVIEKDKKIIEQQEDIDTREETIGKLISERSMATLTEELNRKRAETSDTNFINTLRDTKQFITRWDEITKELVKSGTSQGISEDKAVAFENTKNEMLKKIEEEMTKTSNQRAIDAYNEIAKKLVRLSWRVPTKEKETEEKEMIEPRVEEEKPLQKRYTTITKKRLFK